MQPQMIATRGTAGSAPPSWDEYAARRARAYSVGEAKARRREISADAYLFLYKELVGLAGERTYCWPGLDYLATTLETSTGTIKRWIGELERADLIRRKPRPGGQTSLTYITAYLPPDSGADPTSGEDGAPQDVANEPTTAAALDSAAPADPSAPAQAPSSAALPPAQPTRSPLFFGPELRIITDRCVRSRVIPHTIKTQEFKNLGGYGGGTLQRPNRRPAINSDPAVFTLLQAEGVCDPDAVADLQRKPLADLRALSHYLDKQTNIQCRPGLFVWLARQNFGAQLLAGRHQRKTAICTHSAAPIRTVENATNGELLTLWQRVLDHLIDALPPEDFATWLAPTTLQAIEGQDIVLGTPNVFVRQELEGRFRAPLVAALEAVLGHAVVVHLIIGQL